MARGRRLLLVQPDSSSALMLRQLLLEAGWEVAGICRTVDEAAEMAGHYQPSAAIVDPAALPAREPSSLSILIELGVIPIIIGKSNEVGFLSSIDQISQLFGTPPRH